MQNDFEGVSYHMPHTKDERNAETLEHSFVSSESLGNAKFDCIRDVCFGFYNFLRRVECAN